MGYLTLYPTIMQAVHWHSSWGRVWSSAGHRLSVFGEDHSYPGVADWEGQLATGTRNDKMQWVGRDNLGTRYGMEFFEINVHVARYLVSFITVRGLRISLLFSDSQFGARAMKTQKNFAKGALISHHIVATHTPCRCFQNGNWPMIYRSFFPSVRLYKKNLRPSASINCR